MKSDFTSRLKYGVSAFAVAAMLPISIQTSYAAEDAAAEEDVTFEEVVVTGSRIKRKDLTSPSPVAIVNADEFKFSGTINVEQVLNALPQTVPGLTGNSNNPGNGTATIDLRGLGSTRTLVLVNGKRYLQSSQGNTVDLNTIPSALIKQVEVLTGGASAVYGSDALAGVVNFVLIDDFEGVELNAQYGTSSKGDAEKWNVDATIGGNFADGRGNVVLHTSFARRKATFADARDFSFYALGDNDVLPGTQDPDFGFSTPCGGATNCVPGFTKSGSAGIPGTRVWGFDPSVFGRFGPNGEALPWDNVNDRFNYAPDNFIQLPQDRWLVSAQAHYDINDNVTFYSNAIFTHNRSDTELAPTPAFLGSLEVDVDSPYFAPDTQAILAGVDTDGDGFFALPFIGRRMVENGSRQGINTRVGFQVTTGFKGAIDDNWSYDTYYSYARVDRTQLLNNDVSDSRFRQSMRTEFDADGNLVCTDTSGGCVPMNIFGEGNISPEAVAFVNVGAANVTDITQQVLAGNVTGTLGDLGAGDIGLSAGAEYRTDSSSFRPDEFLSAGDVLGFNAGKPTIGSYNVYDIYAEVFVPLLADVEFAEALNFTGAARYSDYSTAGGVWTYAAGLDWTPVEGFMVRGQYQRAVRAPNVAELFLGAANGFPRADDPCSADHVADHGGIAALTAICEATGVPTGQTGVFNQANTQIEGIFGGNPDLTEESSDTYTIGAVINPEFLDGFSLTVDYYNIKITDVVGSLGGGVNNILKNCYADGDVSAPFCQAITRRPDGNVDTVAALNANNAILQTEGVDVQVNYSIDLDNGLFDNASTISMFWLGTYVIKNDFLPNKLPDTEFLRCAGTFAGVCGTPDPTYRFTSRLSYESGPFAASLKWTYLGAVDQGDIENGGADPATMSVSRLSAKSYFDLTANYDITENYSIYGGINNLLNTKPQFVGSDQQQGNTFPNVYDVIGTYFFFGGTAKF
ncbi:TonB-dependent receptor [hydrothermal vent metagenome]|uniref:TonB-dependent receptor n=1 Tax=hydrothermal vent metagenome TaxID=652676 RepID=A0A3B0T0V2_9ZZZZ